MKAREAVGIAAAVVALAAPALVQTALAGDGTEDGERPRVGLVLGGGGARGAAHIGVLRELERLKVPVDAIVGTSMGAVIGGLYASGMRADDLEALVADIDWAEALSDAPDRRDLSFRRKQDDARFPIDLEIGFGDGELKLPQGVLQGQQLDLLLRRLTLETSHVRNFDDLAIPFRAIATDLASGEAVVIGEGDLARAIRASMSVPGAFAPVEIDGHLLVDGGLTGNLGIGIMQSLDVDVIIAVDVEFPLYPVEALDSALAVSEQVLTILIRNETQRQIARLSVEDVLIRPELGEFGSSDFGRSLEALEPGREAARAEAGRLAQLSLDDAGWRHYLERFSGERAPPGNIDFVRAETDGVIPPDALLRRLHIEPGDPIDVEVLADEVDRLYGLRVFEKINYRLVEDAGRTGIVFDVAERDWGPNFLLFGLQIENDFEGGSSFDLAMRVRRPGVNALGAEWLTDVRVGSRPLLASEFYQPLGSNSSFFIAPNLSLSQENIDAFEADQRTARLRVAEARIGIDAGMELGNRGEFRVGLFRGAGDADISIGDAALSGLDYEIGGASARLRIDTFDNAFFPREGVRADLNWELSRPGLGADSKFDLVSFDYNQAFSRGKSTLVAGIDLATSFSAENLVEARFPAGGFLRLSGLEQGQLGGPHAGIMRLVYFRRVGTSAGDLLELPIYLGASVEAGNVWQSRDDAGFDDLIMNGSVFLGLDTFIGPLYLAVGLAEGGQRNFYLFIGPLPD